MTYYYNNDSNTSLEQLEYELFTECNGKDRIEDLECNNKQSILREVIGIRSQQFHVTSIHLQGILYFKAKERTCTCIIRNCTIRNFVQQILDETCTCIEDPVQNGLIQRTRVERFEQAVGVNSSYVLIKRNTKYVYIYSPHAYAYVTINKHTTLKLNKGITYFCICNIVDRGNRSKRGSYINTSTIS